MNLPSIVLGLALGAGVSGAMAAAVEDSPTLQRIRAASTITLGHRETTIPFSYDDDRRQVVGYAQDLMMKVVTAIKAELNLPKLSVKLVPVSAGTRFSVVQDGQLDLGCSTTTNTLERPRRVAFATSICMTIITGRTVAYLMDDAVICGRRLQANNPSEWIVVGEALFKAPNDLPMP